jgi:hypothetical protein
VLNTLWGLRWLVAARNEIHSLMLALYERWDGLEDDRTREFSAAIAFSLWRAAFLIHEKEVQQDSAPRDRDADRVKNAAAFLRAVIEKNVIGFADDDKHRAWTAGYYVNNAVYRTCELWGRPIESADLERMPLRSWWNWTFRHLRVVVDTGSAAPPRDGYPHGPSEEGPTDFLSR